MIDGKFNYNFLASEGGEVFFLQEIHFIWMLECDDYVTGQQKQPHGALSSMRRQRKSTADRLTRGDGIRRKDLTHMKVQEASWGESSHLIQNETLDITSGKKHSYHHAVLYTRTLLPVQTLSLYRMLNNTSKNKKYTKRGKLPHHKEQSITHNVFKQYLHYHTVLHTLSRA